MSEDLEIAAPSPQAPAGVIVRPGETSDMAAVAEIYAAHVRRGTGTFDETPLDVVAMTERFEASRGHDLPFLVGTEHGRVAGYAYASMLRPRSAYRFCVEDSVYVHPDMIGKGIGRSLLKALIGECEALGYRQMVAVIGDSDNTRSISLHAALGFEHSGTLDAVGFKFGRWLDVVFMQRPLGDGRRTLPLP